MGVGHKLFFFVLTALLFTVLFSSISPEVLAQISISDKWDAIGEVIVGGTGWTARFRKQEGASVISYHNKVIKLIPFNSEGVRPNEITSCTVAKNKEEKHELLFN